MRAALALLLAAGPAIAQDDPAALRRHAADASARAGRIEAQARSADRDADRALDEAARVAGRMVEAEADTDRARAEIARIDRLRVAQRARLDAARAPVAQLAAALETLARRPRALAVASPESIADIVHTKLALHAALPAIAERTAALRAEIAEGDRLRGEADAAVARLDAATRRLDRERAAFVQLAAQHRERAAGLADAALHETDRALAYRADARDIREDIARRAADEGEARYLLALPAPEVDNRPFPLPKPSNWSLPVAGRLVTGFGEMTEEGMRSRGIVLAPPANAPVRAPATGRVAFAGPFRGYGQVLILAHSGRWTTIITGLAALSVRDGEHIAPGRPLGRAGPRLAIELRQGETPVDVAAMAARG